MNSSDLFYQLPESKIAQHPLVERDQCKLLVYDGSNIVDTNFDKIINHLKSNDFLIFNNTKVIPARLKFKKSTGAVIEVFCLNPVEEKEKDRYSLNFSTCVWECYIGNKKKWKNDEQLEISYSNHLIEATLKANLIDSKDYIHKIQFEWKPSELSFYTLLEYFGEVPLPPYIKRKVENVDQKNYQTIYAENKGSVAAPTAGLHFTEQLIKRLKENNIKYGNITLHVGAGTFAPMTQTDLNKHIMHTERIIFTKDFLKQLINVNQNPVSIGTTSCRAIESLYWLGVLIHNDLLKSLKSTFFIKQWIDKELESSLNPTDSIINIINLMDSEKIDLINGETQIMITPGYSFKFIKGLITNFHQPNSTLLALIAAFIGDEWKNIYQHALYNQYRFLSYGDACFFRM